MDDEMIVRLYWDRNEQAIRESSDKYGRYVSHIAHNILRDKADEEECVNDTWMHAWNAMPPGRPAVLSVFLGKITRNLCFDRYKKKHSLKRGGHETDLVLDELDDIVSGKDDPEEGLKKKELAADIDRFLGELPEDKRYIFILRYWYADSIADIAERFHISVGNVSVILNRLRKKLKTYLTERGYDI